MASTPGAQDAFVESVLRFVAHFGFDGFDFDWEYPGARGGIAEDRENFVQVLTKLKARLSKWNLMLTCAVPVSSDITVAGYDIAKISNIVDHVFLMAYDFTTTGSNVTGLIAPMTEIVSNNRNNKYRVR